MKTLLALLTLGTIALAGEKQLFNGKDLTGWKGFTELWSVKDGTITSAAGIAACYGADDHGRVARTVEPAGVGGEQAGLQRVARDRAGDARQQHQHTQPACRGAGRAFGDLHPDTLVAIDPARER